MGKVGKERDEDEGEAEGREVVTEMIGTGLEELGEEGPDRGKLSAEGRMAMSCEGDGRGGKPVKRVRVEKRVGMSGDGEGGLRGVKMVGGALFGRGRSFLFSL